MEKKFYMITAYDENEKVLYRGLRGEKFQYVSGIPEELSEVLKLTKGQAWVETYKPGELRKMWEILKRQEKEKKSFEELVKNSGRLQGYNEFSARLEDVLNR